MIISHKYKFIFIKTMKTAGSSLEMYLHPFVGDRDVVTRLGVASDNEEATALVQNCLFSYRLSIFLKLLTFKKGRKALGNYRKHHYGYFEHMPAWQIKLAVGDEIWNSYFKFCVVRNPYDLTISHYYFKRKLLNRNLSFDEYLQGKVGKNSSIYCEPKTGKVMVDRVLRYEKLNEELADVFGSLNVPFAGELKVFKKNGYRKDRRPYQEFLNTEQAKRIKEIHAREFELFGYKF